MQKVRYKAQTQAKRELQQTEISMNKIFWVSGVALLAFSIYILSNLFSFGFLVSCMHIVVLFVAIIMVMYMCYIDGLTAGYKKYMEKNTCIDTSSVQSMLYLEK